MLCPLCKQSLRCTRAPAAAKQRCYACGRAPTAVSAKHFQCLACEGVALCKKCRLCPNGHHLKRVTALVERTGKRYDKTYVCDLCSSTMTALPQEGIFHCTACTWDCCEECEGRARRSL